jgi:hypothetical protein
VPILELSASVELTAVNFLPVMLTRRFFRAI